MNEHIIGAHHVHTPDDGRGKRNVFVNGVLIDGVTYADTLNGLVIYAPKPYRVAKGKDYIYTRKLRGAVTVVPV